MHIRLYAPCIRWAPQHLQLMPQACSSRCWAAAMLSWVTLGQPSRSVGSYNMIDAGKMLAEEMAVHGGKVMKQHLGWQPQHPAAAERMRRAPARPPGAARSTRQPRCGLSTADSVGASSSAPACSSACSDAGLPLSAARWSGARPRLRREKPRCSYLQRV